jgi:hypothetical protein
MSVPKVYPIDRPQNSPDSANSGLPQNSVSGTRSSLAFSRLLSTDDIATLLHAGRRTVERMRAGGKLPKPDLFVGKMPRWKADTIFGWIDAQSAGKRGGR